MTKQEIQRLRQNIFQFMDSHRLRDAILEIKKAAQANNVWHIKDRIEQVEQNYRYMLDYIAQGANDPQRDEVYNGLVHDIYTTLDLLINHIESQDSPALYYSNIRYLRMQNPKISISELLNRYEKLHDELSLFTMVITSEDTGESAKRREIEKLQSDIFMVIWCTPQLSNEDTEALKNALQSDVIPNTFKQHIVSALTLGTWQQYDKRKLELLMTTYLQSEDIKVSSAAIVGMLLALWKYSNIPLSRKLSEILMTVKEKKNWSRDLRLAFIEIIRARDTERINRKMRDEVIPKMAKIRPDLVDKINKVNLDPDDPMALQENPEWQELLEKSGVADQLKELTEIQLEGGDVMMSTFANLKQFPFFNNISNWFLPFDSHHSSVSETMKGLDIVGDMMDNARFLCDNDKYSFIMAIESVPKEQRHLMISQMQSQSESIYEAMSQMDSDDTQEGRRLALNNYMQNIYRFFKLYYRKSEFFDPFDQGINLTTVPSLAEDFDDVEMLQVVAEFYFKLKYMQEAINVYTRIEDIEVGDASRYQKMGYCYECLQDNDKAIDFYQRAEILDSQSKWTLRRLASCYRAIGDKAKALQYYRQLSDADPDNLNIAMLYGQSLLENDDYKEALHQFYKVEFLDEKSHKAYRPLAWTLFITGDLKSSEDYYIKILADDPTANDYLNYGHVVLANGRTNDAISHYVKAIKAKDGDIDWFIKTLNTDKDALHKAGVDSSIISLIADAAAYRAIYD